MASLNYVINMTTEGLESLQSVITELRTFQRLVQEGATFPIRIEGGLLDRLGEDVRKAVQDAFMAAPEGRSTSAAGGGGAPGTGDAASVEQLVTIMTRVLSAIQAQEGGRSSTTSSVSENTKDAREKAKETEFVDTLVRLQQGLTGSAKAIDDLGGRLKDAIQRDSEKGLDIRDTGDRSKSEFDNLLTTQGHLYKERLADTARSFAEAIFTANKYDAAAGQRLAKVVLGGDMPAEGIAGKRLDALTRLIEQALIKQASSSGGSPLEMITELGGYLKQLANHLQVLITGAPFANNPPPSQRRSEKPDLGTGSIKLDLTGINEALNAAEIKEALKKFASEMILLFVTEMRTAMGKLKQELATDRPDNFDLPPLDSDRANLSKNVRQGSALSNLDRQILATQVQLEREMERIGDDPNPEEQARLGVLREKLAQLKARRAATPGSSNMPGISQKEADIVGRLDPTSGAAYYAAKGSDFMEAIRTSVTSERYDRARQIVSQKMMPVMGKPGTYFNDQYGNPISQDDVVETFRVLGPGSKGLDQSMFVEKGKKPLIDQAIFDEEDPTKQFAMRRSMATARERAEANFASAGGETRIPLEGLGMLQSILSRAIEGVERALDEGTKVDEKTNRILDGMAQLPVFKRLNLVEVETAEGQREFRDVARTLMQQLKGGASIAGNVLRGMPTFSKASGMYLNDTFLNENGRKSTALGDNMDPMGNKLDEDAKYAAYPLTPYSIELARANPNLSAENRAQIDKDEQAMKQYMAVAGAYFYRMTKNRAENVERRMGKILELYNSIAINKEIPSEYTGLLGTGDSMSPEGFASWLNNIDQTLPPAKQKKNVRIGADDDYSALLENLVNQYVRLQYERLGGGLILTPDDPRAQRRGIVTASGVRLLGTENDYEKVVANEQFQPERRVIKLMTKEDVDKDMVPTDGYGLARVSKVDQLGWVQAMLRSQSAVSVDIETFSKTGKQGDAVDANKAGIRTLQIGFKDAVDGVQGILIDLKDIGVEAASMKEVMQLLTRGSMTKVGHNLKFENQFFEKYFGMTLGDNIIDTMFLGRAYNQGRGLPGAPATLEALASNEKLLGLNILGKGTIQTSFTKDGELDEGQIRYSMTDVLILFKLIDELTNAINGMPADARREAIANLRKTMSPAMLSQVSPEAGEEMRAAAWERVKAHSANLALNDDETKYVDLTTNELLERVSTVLNSEFPQKPLSPDALARGETAKPLGNAVDEIFRDVILGVEKKREDYLNKERNPVVATQEVFDKLVKGIKDFRQQMADAGWSFISSEQVKLSDPNRKIAGTSDLIMMNDRGEQAVIDLKTFGNLRTFLEKLPRYDRQTELYAQMLEPITQMVTALRGILPIFLKYDTGTEVIQDVDVKPLEVSRGRRTAEDGPRTQSAEERIANLNRQLDALSTIARDLAAGANAEAMERARKEMGEQGMNIDGLTADQMIEELRKRIASLMARRDNLIEGRGRGEKDALTGDVNTVSPGIEAPRPAPGMDASTAARGGMGGDCCDRIIKAIRAFHDDVKRMSTGKQALSPQAKKNDIQEAVKQLGGFTPAELRQIGKKLTIAEIEVVTKDRKLQLAKEARMEAERNRLMRNTDTFINYDPRTQQQLIDENTRQHLENREVYMKRMRVAANAAATTYAASERAALDLNLISNAGLTPRDEAKLQRRAARTDEAAIKAVMDLARRFQGAGRTDQVFKDTVTEGDKLLAGRLGLRSAKAYDEQVKYQEEQLKKELEKRTEIEAAINRRNELNGARSDAATNILQTEEVQRRKLAADRASERAQVGSKDQIRQVLLAGNLVPNRGGFVLNEKDPRAAMTDVDAAVEKILTLLKADRLGDPTANAALRERVLNAFFDTEKRIGTRSKSAKDDTQVEYEYTVPLGVNMSRGMNEVDKITNERAGQLKAALDRLQEAQDAKRFLEEGLAKKVGTQKDANDYQRIVNEELEAARKDLRLLTGFTTEKGQDKALESQTQRVERYQKMLDETKKKQKELFEQLRKLLGDEVKDIDAIDKVTKQLNETFRKLSEQTRNAGDALLKNDGRSFWQGAADRLRSLTQYAFAGSIVYTGAAKIKQTVTELNQVDSELARLQGLFPGRSAASRATVSEGAFQTARDYGTTPIEALKSARIFAQTGAGPTEAVQLSRAALASQIALNIEPQVANEMLVSTRNVFDDQIKPFELLDRIARLEARYAVSTNDLSMAVQRAGPLFKQFQTKNIGDVTPLDLLLGATTSIVEKTRVTGNQAATSLRFMMSRIAQPDVGRSLQDDFGINLGGATPQELRPISEILKDISKRYQQLMDPSQPGGPRSVEAASLLVTFAGARQANAAAALLENFNESIEKAAESATAYGDVQERLRIQLDTVQGRFGQFNAALMRAIETILVQGGGRETAKAGLRLGTWALDQVADSWSPGLMIGGISAAVLGVSKLLNTGILQVLTKPGGNMLTNASSSIMNMMGGRAGTAINFLTGVGTEGPLVAGLTGFSNVLGAITRFFGPAAMVGAIIAAFQGMTAIFDWFVGAGEKFNLGKFDRKAFEKSDLFADVTAQAEKFEVSGPDELTTRFASAAKIVIDELKTNNQLTEEGNKKLDFSKVDGPKLEAAFIRALKEQKLDFSTENKTLPDQLNAATMLAANLAKYSSAESDDMYARMGTKIDDILKDLKDNLEVDTGFFSRDRLGKKFTVPSSGLGTIALEELVTRFSAKNVRGTTIPFLPITGSTYLEGTETTVRQAMEYAATTVGKKKAGGNYEARPIDVLGQFYEDNLRLRPALQKRFRDTVEAMTKAGGDVPTADQAYARIRQAMVDELTVQYGSLKSTGDIASEVDMQLVDAKRRMANQLSLQEETAKQFARVFGQGIANFGDEDPQEDRPNPLNDYLKDIVEPGLRLAQLRNKVSVPQAEMIKEILRALREASQPSSKADLPSEEESDPSASVRLRERMTRPFIELYRGREELLASSRLAPYSGRAVNRLEEERSLLSNFYMSLTRLRPELEGEVLNNQVRLALLASTPLARGRTAFTSGLQKLLENEENSEKKATGSKLLDIAKGTDKSAKSPDGIERARLRIEADLKSARAQLNELNTLSKSIPFGSEEMRKAIDDQMSKMIDMFATQEAAGKVLAEAAQSGDKIKIDRALEAYKKAITTNTTSTNDTLVTVRGIIGQATAELEKITDRDRATATYVFLEQQRLDIRTGQRRRELGAQASIADQRGRPDQALPLRVTQRQVDLNAQIVREQMELEKQRKLNFGIQVNRDANGVDWNAVPRKMKEKEALDEYYKRNADFSKQAYDDILEMIGNEEVRLASAREEQFRSLLDGSTSGLREVLMDFSKLRDKPLKVIIPAIAQTFQARIVDNFLDSLFGPMGVLTDKMRSAFNFGAAHTYSKIYDGHVAGMRAAAELLRQTWEQMAGMAATNAENPGKLPIPGQDATPGALENVPQPGAPASVSGKVAAAPITAATIAAAGVTLKGSRYDLGNNTGIDISQVANANVKASPNKWKNLADNAMYMGGQLGGAWLGSQAMGGADYASEGASIGTMLGSAFGPVGGLVGGLLGGFIGGRMGKDEEKDPIPTEVLQKIERNTRETVKAFENQTALLQLDSRFLNVPTGFTVPRYQPAMAGAVAPGAPVTYTSNNSVNVNVTVPEGTDTAAVGRQVAQEIQRQLGRMGSTFDVRTM